MSVSNETTTKFKVDISDLKKNIREAERQIKIANAEFKAAAAGMDNWAASTDGLSAKIDRTEKVLKSQEKILKEYEKQLDLTAKEYGENSKEADDLRIKILNKQAAIKETEKELNGYKKSLADLEDEQKRAAEAAGKEESALSKLQNTISEQEKDLKDLKTQYANVALEQGDSSKEAKALAKEIETLSSELSQNKTKLNDVEKAADDLDEGLKDTKKDADKANDGFTVMKGVLSNLVTQGINLAIDALKKLGNAAKEAYQEFDTGRDEVIKATGATGEAAKALTKNYKNVAKSVNADMTSVGKAVGEVSTKFGLQGEQLEELSTFFLKFSEINNTDVTTSIDKAQKAMSAYGLKVEDATHFLDVLTATSQETGINVDTLANGIVSNGTAFQEMGLSIEQAVSLMGQLEMSGANSETVLNGMRKALKASAKDGVSINDALRKLQKTIDGSTNSTEGLNAAYALFGRSGDQIYGAVRNGTLNFNELAKSSSDAAGSVENTYNETQSALDKVRLKLQWLKVELGDGINKLIKEYGPDIKDMIDTIKPKLEALYKAIKAMFNFVSKNGKEIISILGGMAAAVAAYVAYTTAITVMTQGWAALTVVTKAQAVAQAALNAVMSANPIGLVVAAIAGLVTAFTMLWNNSEEFREFWINLWNTIKEKAVEIIDAVKQYFSDLWEAIKLVCKDTWEAIKFVWSEVKGWFKEKVIDPVVKFFTEFWNGLKNGAATAVGFVKTTWNAVTSFFKNIVTSIGNFFTGLWNGLKSGAKGAWEGITGVFSGIAGWFGEKFTAAWQAVKDVFSTGGKVFDGIKDGIVSTFTTVVNAIIRGINKVVAVPFNAINSILKEIKDVTIVGYKPFEDIIGTLPVPQIPELARGGILKKGQVGLLEGRGTEAVVPLEHNKAWIAATARDMKSSLAKEGMIDGSGKGTVNNYNFVQNNNSPKALSRLDIYRQTRNQLRFARGI